MGETRRCLQGTDPPTDPLVCLLGEELHTRDGKSKVDTLDALKGRENIALYFYAEWCPPCNSYKKDLEEWLKKLKENKPVWDKMAVIFVDWDVDLNGDERKKNIEYFTSVAFDDNFYAVLFDKDEERKMRLMKKYSILAVPSMAVISKSGELYTNKGREYIDEKNYGFPWIHNRQANLVNLLTQEGTKTTAYRNKPNGKDDVLKQEEDINKALTDKYLALFFSAHWCAPCKLLVPYLKEQYEKNKEQLEVIFISSDRNVEEYHKYRKELMPDWLCLPFQDDRIPDLKKTCNADELPTLIMYEKNHYDIITIYGQDELTEMYRIEEWLQELDKELKTDIDADKRDRLEIEQKIYLEEKKKRVCPWRPAYWGPLDDETTEEVLNDTACLIFFTRIKKDRWDADREKTKKWVKYARELMEDQAIKYNEQRIKSKGACCEIDELIFFFQREMSDNDLEDPGEAVLDFMFEDALDRIEPPMLMLLDIPSQKFYCSKKEDRFNEDIDSAGTKDKVKNEVEQLARLFRDRNYDELKNKYHHDIIPHPNS